MTFRKQYSKFKKTLQLCLLINGLFIAAGIAALYHYFQDHRVDGLFVFIAGCGTFVFGVLLPWYIFKKLAELNKLIRQQTEQAVTKVLAGLLENYKESSGDILNSPVFWINCFLTITEIFVEQSENPTAKTLAEIIPMLRQEFKKSKSKKKS